MFVVAFEQSYQTPRRMHYVLILMGLYVAVALGYSGRRCPAGWKNIGSGCYNFPLIVKNEYQIAVSTCKSLGGQVFVPNSKAEIGIARMPYITQHKDTEIDDYIWVGCVYDDANITFLCVDGSSIGLTNADMWPNDHDFGSVSAALPGQVVATFVTVPGGLYDVIVTKRLAILTLCEVEPLPDPPQLEARPTSSVFAQATDRKGRAPIGYCGNDHVMKLAPIGGKAQYAVVCKSKCY
ncbi:uncharacterized protein LOC121413003 [Lytechinus variegatus]|uniref:uncharacterized protein LOC121413003 n=1 Tax=Lytechinus variegatus TaxID=7654 RepID=UPI001BB26045|nr:uncharacterized protein LOC121413003 [Lytechinus variegatus]